MASDIFAPTSSHGQGHLVGGVSSAEDRDQLIIRIDPTTKRLLVDINGADLISDGDAVDAANDGYLALGTDGTNYQVLATDSSGNLQVDVLTGGGGTQYTEGDTDATITGMAAMMEVASNILQPIQGTVADGLLINLGTNNDVSLNAGSNAIGKLAANSGVDIGDVDVTSVIPGIGATNLGKADNSVFASGDVGIGSYGVYNTQTITNGLTAHSEGDWVPYSIDAGSNLRVALYSGNAEYATAASGADGVTNTSKDLRVDSRDYYFNGITWDRVRGDLTDGLLVNLGTNNDITLASTTITGTVAVTGTFWQATQPVSATSLPLPTGAATETTLGTIDVDTGNIVTAVQLIDDTVYTDGTGTPSKGLLVMGTDGTNPQALAVDATGNLQVDILNASIAVTGTFYQATQPVSIAAAVAVTQSGTWDEVGINDSGNAITVDWAGTAPPIGAGLEATALRVTVATDSTGVLSVDDNGGALTVDGTVTANLSATDNAVLDQIELNTDPLLVVGTGTEATAQRVTIATDSTGVLSVDDNGGILTVDGTVTANLSATDNAVLDAIEVDTTTIAGAVAGTEMQVDVVAALPAGTNAIGKLAANTGVDIGDVDVTSVVPGTGATNLGKAEDAGHTSGDVGVMALGVRTDVPNAANPGTTADYAALSTDMVGGIRTALYETDFAVLGTSHVKKYYTNAGAVTDGIIWSPAAGKRWYVTDIFIQVSAAATVTLEDDLAGGDSAIWKAELAANSGWSHSFNTPWFSGEDAADLIITTSAANVYVTVTGYEI